MKQRSWFGTTAAVAVLTAALILAVTPTGRMADLLPIQPPHYRVMKLPVPADTVFVADALNDRGEVVGSTIHLSKSDPISAAFSGKAALWNGQRFRVAPEISGMDIHGLNDQGQALVGGVTSGGAELWSKNGTVHIPQFWAIAMNNRGEIVGRFAPKNAWPSSAYYWARGKLTDISFGHPDMVPNSINDKGQVVGVSYQHVPPHRPPHKKIDFFDQMMDAAVSKGTVYLLNPGAKRWTRINLLDAIPPVLIPGASVHKLIINCTLKALV